MYTKKIPTHQDVIRLSTLMQSYPVTRSEAVRTARMWNLSDEVISFLRMFSADERFETRTDLVTRAEELALRIRHEWESPKTRLFNS